MATFLYLFQNDITNPAVANDMPAWGKFIDGLRAAGHFVGGGPLGGGYTRRDTAVVNKVTGHFAGYMVVHAQSLEQATALLDACPTIGGGGSVEVRVVPQM